MGSHRAPTACDGKELLRIHSNINDTLGLSNGVSIGRTKNEPSDKRMPLFNRHRNVEETERSGDWMDTELFLFFQLFGHYQTKIKSVIHGLLAKSEIHVFSM